MQSLLPYLLIFYYTSLAIHGAYVVFFYLRFLRVKTAFSEDRASELPALSVLIAARNESENLYELLPKVMEQDYPCFEVVVVNNQSTDESIWLLKAYERQFPNLKIVQLEKSRHLRPGKKLPLTLAIKAAKYDHFVFTDADCIPASRSWLRAMAQGFAQGKEIVMGYGPHRKKPGFQPFDSLRYGHHCHELRIVCLGEGTLHGGRKEFGLFEKGIRQRWRL